VAGFLITCRVLAFSGFVASLFFHLSAIWGLNILPVDWSNYDFTLFYGALLTGVVTHTLLAVQPGGMTADGVVISLEGCPKWMKFPVVALLVNAPLSSLFFSDYVESELERWSGLWLFLYFWGFASFYSIMAKRGEAKSFDTTSIAVANPINRLLGWRRNKLLRRVASEIGFTFHTDVSSVLTNNSHPLDHSFPLPRTWDITNVQEGILRGNVSSNEVLLFDFDMGDEETYKVRTIACFQLHEKASADFELRPKTTFETVKSLFSGTDPEFLGVYVVRWSSDVPPECAQLPEGIGKFCLPYQGWFVEVNRGWLFVYRSGCKVRPGELPSFLNETKRIFMLFSKE